ncbi:hypothetical protein CC1G_09864 [Coprinopsis cinerea okayama7|uniref:F-box domain-containing protein n=1 Tax=Coprinopsis cinerea (strain Okayama-7 / 130 / ATCC MYA-4618 / FGSC 9003) TaxID=240176 RepID=A8N8K5_COPC7|nr:hypothetical protein CC1G_09864 [Coprinopsis cinerea okayama7\|eukprot:XP_001831161.2 hypothetical protein CC1G_09864 [Coprinopsis cinerea okayama7\
MAKTLPLEIVATIIRLCSRDTLARLSLVNWFFKNEAEPLLYRSITVKLDNSRAGRVAAFACLRALMKPEKAKMVTHLKIFVSGPMMTLVNKILVCMDHMDNLKHLRLEVRVPEYCQESTCFWEFPSKLLCRNNFQLSSFGYHPSYARLFQGNDELKRHQLSLEVIALWGHTYFYRQDLLQLIVRWAAENPKVPALLGFEPYYPPEDSEQRRLPIICTLAVTGRGKRGEQYEVCLFPGLYALEERPRICSRVSNILDLEDDGTYGTLPSERVRRVSLYWLGFTNNDTTVSELQRFSESVVASFPALEELWVYIRSSPTEGRTFTVGPSSPDDASLTMTLPPEIVASIIGLCSREALVPLSLVNWFFKVEAEPLLYRSISLDSRTGNFKAIACLTTLSSKPEKARMVQRLKIVLKPLWTLIDRMIAAAEHMDNLKHLDLRMHGDWREFTFQQEFPSKILFRDNFQLTSLGYYTSSARMFRRNDTLTSSQKSLEILGLWHKTHFYRQDLVRILLRWVAENTGANFPSFLGFEPYYPPEDTGRRLPVSRSGEKYGVCLFPGLHATEEERLRICPRVSKLIDLDDGGGYETSPSERVWRMTIYWLGLTSNELSVAELQRFSDSVVSSFPALEELWIYTRFTNDLVGPRSVHMHSDQKPHNLNECVKSYFSK